MMKTPLGSAAALLCVTWSALASAQVTTGKTELTKGVVEKGGIREGDVQDATEMQIQAGALVSGGNSRTAAATVAERFLLRRGPHEYSEALAFNYARSGAEDGGPMETTVENYQLRTRYDYFFTPKFSAFLAVQGRRDRFQGLNLRLGVDPGLSYSFVRDTATRFWLEGGYDFQFDMRTEETRALAEEAGTPLDETEVDHNARFYLGYTQKLDTRLQLASGVELFKSVITEGAWRLNWESTLNVKLVDSFALAIGSLAQYNNAPLPGVDKLDVTTSLSFVYTLL